MQGETEKKVRTQQNLTKRQKKGVWNGETPMSLQIQHPIKPSSKRNKHEERKKKTAKKSSKRAKKSTRNEKGQIIDNKAKS